MGQLGVAAGCMGMGLLCICDLLAPVLPLIFSSQ